MTPTHSYYYKRGKSICAGKCTLLSQASGKVIFKPQFAQTVTMNASEVTLTALCHQ